MVLARPLRNVCAALAVGAYVAAATAPCPAPTTSPARTSSQAPRTATHAAHHDHGGSTQTADSAHSGTESSIAAPCACGCGKRAGTVSMARLGPVLLSGVLAFALPSASSFDASLPRRAISIALSPPDPVPIARFA